MAILPLPILTAIRVPHDSVNVRAKGYSQPDQRSVHPIHVVQDILSFLGASFTFASWGWQSMYTVLLHNFLPSPSTNIPSRADRCPKNGSTHRMLRQTYPEILGIDDESS